MKKLKITIVLILSQVFLYSQTEDSCLPEGITFNTQEEIDNFQTNYPTCTEIEGDVTIDDNYPFTITNLNGLSILTAIGGNLEIIGSGALVDLSGLEGLITIEGDLTIGQHWGGNYSLTYLFGLENLISIGGNLNIEENDALINLSGLNNLLTIGDSLNLIFNEILYDLTGLESLTSIGESIYIIKNWSLHNINSLGNLTSVGKNIKLDRNLVLNSIIGLINLTEINGSLSIENSNLNNLSGLENITSIGGNLILFGNHFLSSISALSNLSSIPGNLIIDECYALNNLSGLNNISSIGGNFILSENYFLNDLTGLFELETIGGGLIIYFNNGLNDLGGLDNLSFAEEINIYDNEALNSLTGLSNLTTIQGQFRISGNHLLIDLSGLNNLSSIGGQLLIQYNSNLTGLSGLESLEYVGWSCKLLNNTNLSSIGALNSLTTLGSKLHIEGNHSLSNLSGLENINSIGGDLYIKNNNLISNITALNGLSSLGGSIDISNNQVLTSLTGLDNIDPGTIDDVSISNNNSLSYCQITSLCEYLMNPNGTLDIYNNSNSCNSPAEIAYSCGNTLPCLPYGNYYFNKQSQIDDFVMNYPDCYELNGNVQISGNDITNLNGLSEITSIEASLEIIENSILTDITGLENTELMGYILTIVNNENLSFCSMESICDYIPGWFNEIWIANNATGCNSYEEVDSLCNITSIEKEKFDHKITISPNPVNKQAVLSLNINSKSSVEICIYNTTGICIKTWQFQNQPPGEKEFKLDLKDIPVGVYFCRVKLGNEMVTKKIIKL